MGKDIKKRRKLIDDQELQLRKGKEKNKCECLHTRHGELNVVPSKNKRPDHLEYICNDCRKEIVFNKIPERTVVTDEHGNVLNNVKVTIGLVDACNAIDAAVDTIKITLDTQNDKDKKIGEELALYQYRTRNQISQLYGKALQKQGGNRGNKKQNNYNESSWNKPQMNR